MRRARAGPRRSTTRRSSPRRWTHRRSGWVSRTGRPGCWPTTWAWAMRRSHELGASTGCSRGGGTKCANCFVVASTYPERPAEPGLGFRMPGTQLKRVQRGGMAGCYVASIQFRIGQHDPGNEITRIQAQLFPQHVRGVADQVDAHPPRSRRKRIVPSYNSQPICRYKAWALRLP